MTKCEPIQIGITIVSEYNEHNPHDYVERLKEYTDTKLYDSCKDTIWLSAYAANNHRSDFHWMCDACYAECSRRKKPEIYSNAHNAVARSV
jgi:hypothetical protein